MKRSVSYWIELAISRALNCRFFRWLRIQSSYEAADYPQGGLNPIDQVSEPELIDHLINQTQEDETPG